MKPVRVVTHKSFIETNGAKTRGARRSASCSCWAWSFRESKSSSDSTDRGDLMRPTLLVLLCSAYISTCAAEDLKEPRRTSFVDAAFKSCFKNQTENPLNKRVGSAAIAQYCLCFANKFADNTSPDEIAELDELTLREPATAMARKATLINSLGDQCRREVFK
jgi:hypothetical protein